MSIEQAKQSASNALAIVAAAEEHASGFEVRDESSSVVASGMLRLILTQRDAIEAERKKITQPLHQAWRAANDFFGPPVKRLDILAAKLKRAIGDYHLAVERERADTMARLAAGAPVPATPVPIVPEAQGVTTRIVQRWRISDPAAVPRELCLPSEALIQRSIDRGVTPPGVEWYEEAQTIARRVK